MQARLGEPLDSVRLHVDTTAAAAAAQAGANAFTLGEHIHFGAGRFEPHTGAGARRLAHELVHVVQQRRGQRLAPTGSAHEAEREARALGAAMAGGARVAVRHTAPRMLQREGPEADSATPGHLSLSDGAALHLDPDIERLMLRHYVRWWLGNALLRGGPPLTLPDDSAVAPLAQQLPLTSPFFAPLPPDPLHLEPDVGALFSGFGDRGAPVGAGDSAAVFELQRRNAAIALALPDLRAIAPSFLRPLIPSTWRRDVAGAFTSAAVGNMLKGDYPTPIEVSDRAWQAMTGANTTVIPLPAISFDLF